MSPASFPHAHFGGVTLTARQARASSLYRPSTARTLAGTSEPAACLMDPEFVSWAPWRSRFPAEWQGSAQGQALGPRWPAHARAQGAQDLGHGDHVEQVVVEDRHQPVGIAAPDVVVVEVGNLVARHVAGPPAAAHVAFQGLEPAVPQQALPPAPRGVEEIQVARGERHRHPVHVGAAQREGGVVGLAVEGDQELDPSRRRWQT